MLGGIISGLLVAWIISFFGADQLIMQGMFELTDITISNAGYYTIFAIIGIIGGAIKDSRH